VAKTAVDESADAITSLEMKNMRNRSAHRVPASYGSLLGLGALAALLAPLAVACSAKSAAPFPDVTSFCASKAQAECQIATTCGFTSSTDCQTAREALCNQDANDAATSGSHTRKYTQANAAACIGLVNSVYGNNATTIPFAELVGPGSVGDVCERVFSGVAGFNDPCQSSYDCADTSEICAPVLPGSTALVCAKPTMIVAGALCQDPGDQCATDTYCAMASANVGFTCTASLQEGQSCASAPCVSAQRCEVTATGQTCEPRVEANQPCTSNDDCAPEAPYCDPYVGNLCEKGLSFATQAPDCKGFEPGGNTIGVNDDASAPSVNATVPVSATDASSSAD
jgi:hypothetical protein